MSGSQTLPEDHDAQRALEQRSLRNVRALLDKLENEAELERRTRKRIAWVVAIVLAATLAGFYGLALHRGIDRSQDRVIVIPPPAAQR